jgi:hypothetical protein
MKVVFLITCEDDLLTANLVAQVEHYVVFFFFLPEYESETSSSSKEKTKDKNRSKLGPLLL